MNKLAQCFIYFLLVTFCSLPIRAEDVSPLVALGEKNFIGLDNTLNRLQEKFEVGRVTEIELRNAFRPFYKLNHQQEMALREWVKASSKSYSAHLALGIFLKKAGLEARGGKYISQTPRENIVEMQRLFALSKSELNLSLGLSAKPYLTVFHLLDIARTEGDDEASGKLLIQANKMLPNNRLARNRYIVSFEPRWGGSYRQMEKFISDAKKEGVDPEGIMQLEAIMYDDLGLSAWSSGDHKSARNNFLEALGRAKKLGGSFKDDWLGSAVEYICQKSKEPEYCQ
jgi:hypothetical protein